MFSTPNHFPIQYLCGAIHKTLSRIWMKPTAGFRKPLFFLIPTLLFMTAFAHADPFSISITVDENGHGTFTNSSGFSTILNGSLQDETEPTGVVVKNVLTYDLLNPPGLVAGDVEMLEPGRGDSDFVEFNSSKGTLVFFSDKLDGADSLADTGPPPFLFVNGAIVNEVGSEGNNFAIYTPVAGEPGFVAGAAGPVTYKFISDSAVPEPSSLTLLGSGLLGALGIIRRRFHKSIGRS